jgi:hypothetical protein
MTEPTFGFIHDLTSLEIRVRRSLQEAQHELHCALQMLAQDASLDSDAHVRVLAAMLKRAQCALRDVGGG